MSRLGGGSHTGGSGGQRNLFLSDVLRRMTRQFGPHTLNARRVQLPTEHDLTPRTRKRRLENQLGEVLLHEGELTLLSAPPGGDRRHPQLLPEQLSTESREEGHDRRGFHDSGTQCVGNGDVSCSDRLKQSSNPQSRLAI